MIKVKIVVLACALAIIGAACSSSKDNSDDPLVVGTDNETVVMTDNEFNSDDPLVTDNETVVMTDNEFNPGNLQVPVGAQVTFRNDGDAVHNAVADGDDWYTDELGDGDSGMVTFMEPKESNYKCTIHPTMKGKITVVE